MFESSPTHRLVQVLRCLGIATSNWYRLSRDENLRKRPGPAPMAISGEAVESVTTMATKGMQNVSSSFSQNIAVVKYEAYAIAVSITMADAFAECRCLVVKGFEQDVGQNCSFQMAPQSLDQVQIRTVRRQQVDCDPIGVGLEPLLDCTCMVKPSIVAHHANFATGIRLDQGDQEDKEIHPLLLSATVWVTLPVV